MRKNMKKAFKNVRPKPIEKFQDQQSYTSKSGKSVAIKRSYSEKRKAKKEFKIRERALRLASMPKSKIGRFFYRLHPLRILKFWFSKRGFIFGLKLMGIGLVVAFVGLASLFAYFRKDLPNIKDINGSAAGGSVLYYDRTGATLLWEDYASFRRVPVQSDKISKYMKDAMVAAEDRAFYEHNGFNAKAIVRASLNNASGGAQQGASTITQQLVKNTQGWGSDTSVSRKVKELILAIQVEREYGKEEILTAYLNSVSFGGLESGVEAASQTYFNKPALNLTIDEAAFLALIPKSPNVYSPYSKIAFSKNKVLGSENSEGRYQYVLRSMKELGMITEEEQQAALKVDILAKVKDRKANLYENIKAPYFVLAARQELIDTYGGNNEQKPTYVAGKGWKVVTTVDMAVQAIVEEEAKKGITQVQNQLTQDKTGAKTAIVVEDVKTGQVVGMVGGTDFNDKKHAGEVNYATRFLPPGSTIKPYDYVTLIDSSNKFGAGTVLYDTPVKLDGYPCTTKFVNDENNGNCPRDFDGKSPGPLTIRYALGGSRNITAMKAWIMSNSAKEKGVIKTAEALGLKSGYHCYIPGSVEQTSENETDCNTAAAIGDGAYLRLDEHVHGFASISRNGKNRKQTYILRIEDFKGRIVEEWQPSEGTQVVKEESAYLINDILSDPDASYFNTYKPQRYNGQKYAVKTGTTNSQKDGWMLGYTPQYATGVWVGHYQNNIRMAGFMENMTYPIWSGIMHRIHDKQPPQDWPKPAGIKELPAYVNRVGILGWRIPSRSTDLFPSWYTAPSKSGKKQVVDIVSNKLATQCTPERARRVEGSDAADFSADVFAGALSNTSESDDVHRCEDVKPQVKLATPSQTNSGNYTISATITAGTHPIGSAARAGQVTVTVNGGAIPNGDFQISSDGSISVQYSSSATGDVTIGITVVDSVLYTATDSITATLSGAQPAGTITLDQPVVTGTTAGTNKPVSFSWTYPQAGATESYVLTIIKTGGSTTPVTTNLTNYTTSLSPGTYTAAVEVDGVTSATKTVIVP
jgi:membrane peptidoglycan carboxypeptidase